MELFSVYTAWWNYAATLKADAEIEEARAESRLRFTQATKLVESWSTATAKDRVTVAKAERDTDPEVERAEQKLLRAKAERKMYTVTYDNCERCSNLISREVTRRTSSRGVSLQGRADKWNP